MPTPLHDFIAALQGGAPLGAALDALADIEPSQALAGLFEVGAVVAVNQVQRSPKGEPT